MCIHWHNESFSDVAHLIHLIFSLQACSLLGPSVSVFFRTVNPAAFSASVQVFYGLQVYNWCHITLEDYSVSLQACHWFYLAP